VGAWRASWLALSGHPFEIFCADVLGDPPLLYGLKAYTTLISRGSGDVPRIGLRVAPRAEPEAR